VGLVLVCEIYSVFRFGVVDGAGGDVFEVSSLRVKVFSWGH